MEYIFEFIFELLFECGIEASSNKKVPKLIRYPLIVLIVSFFAAVIGLLFVMGLLLWKKNIFVSIFLIILSFVMLFGSINKFKSVYILKRK